MTLNYLLCLTRQFSIPLKKLMIRPVYNFALLQWRVVDVAAQCSLITIARRHVRLRRQVRHCKQCWSLPTMAKKEIEENIDIARSGVLRQEIIDFIKREDSYYSGVSFDRYTDELLYTIATFVDRRVKANRQENDKAISDSADEDR